MRLADLADILPGLAFRSRIEAEPTGGYAIIQARDLGAGGYVQLDSAARIRSLPVSPRGGFLQTGDVLFQPRGARFPAALCDLPQRISAVAAAPLWVLRIDKTRVIPEFLVAVLMSAATQATLRQAAVGTHVPQVQRQAIESLQIELPDLQSQIKLADLARLERRERELIDRLRNARERLFDLAVTGAAKNARTRATASGPEPARDGTRTPRGPLSTPREQRVK
jgi:hypothetical protein